MLMTMSMSRLVLVAVCGEGVPNQVVHTQVFTALGTSAVCRVAASGHGLDVYERRLDIACVTGTSECMPGLLAFMVDLESAVALCLPPSP
jgi:hypothetical protein